MLPFPTPTPVRPELVEGPPCLLWAERTGRKQEQCFDKLSTNGVGVGTLNGCERERRLPTRRASPQDTVNTVNLPPYCTSREDCTTVWNSCDSAAEMSPLVPTVCSKYDPSALRVAQAWSWLWMLGTWLAAKVLKVGCAV